MTVIRVAEIDEWEFIKTQADQIYFQNEKEFWKKEYYRISKDDCINLIKKKELFVLANQNEILGFMKKMNEEMRSRGMVFKAKDIDGGGNIAWAQWVAKTPSGDIEGCGLYRVENGMMTYYKDYMNSVSYTHLRAHET